MADDNLDPIIGFISLGMFEDALEALDELGPSTDTDRGMVLRFDIYRGLEQWELARELAQSATAKFPESPHWWCRWSTALRHSSSVEAARAVLREAVQLHPADPFIQYSLACCSCLMGHLDEARLRLQNAFLIDSEFRKVALVDPDLEILFTGA
ncbi:MAG: tetratricopeptide repeat protein [Verrucomicrobiaceae bacterium]|nr:MAG: tetratricopeptide repeat protein [Verrucomicrobiaceae bacterium]